MSLRNGIFGFILLPVFFAATAQAGLNPTQRGTFKRIFSFSGKPFSEFVENVKPDLHPVDYKYLKSLSEKELKGKAMPQMTMSAEDVVRFEQGRAILDLKIVSMSENKFVVNGHQLDFTNLSLEEKVEKIVRALPATPETGRFGPLRELLLPKAHAVWWAWLLLGAASGAAGTVGVNVAACKEIGETLDKCTGQKTRIAEWADRVKQLIAENEKNKKPAASTKKKKKKSKDDDDEEEEDEVAEAKEYAKMLEAKKKDASYCPNKPISKSLDDDSFDVTSEIKRVADQMQAKYAQCGGGFNSGGQQRRLKQCYHNIEMLAKQHCLTKTKALFKAHSEEEDMPAPLAPVPSVNDGGNSGGAR